MSEFLRSELEELAQTLENPHLAMTLNAVLIRQAITAYDQLSDRLLRDTTAHRAELGRKNDTIRALQALVAATTPEHGSQPESASAGQADGIDPHSGR